MSQRFASVVVALVACGCSGGNNPSIDGGDVVVATDASDAPADTGPADPCAGSLRPVLVSLLPSTTRIVLAPNAHATLEARLVPDATCHRLYPITVDMPGVLTAPMMADLAPGESTFALDITAGAAPGTATLTIGDATSQLRVPVDVRAPADLTCPSSVSASGMLLSGSTLNGTPSTPLAAASLSLSPNASTAPAQTITIACADDLALAGYTAVGPAVSFQGPTTYRYPRELNFTVPFDPTRVGPRDIQRIEIAYTGPSVATPAIVPVASIRWVSSSSGDAIAFDAPRLGTYQAVIANDIGQRTVTRHIMHRAIMGISMGAAGAAFIGTHHPEMFDAVVPLGGPVEWNFVLDVARRHALGGFCTPAQRAADPMGCMAASAARNPPAPDSFAHNDDFEHLYEEGPGGSVFRRADYVTIFRDITRMFGNALVQAAPDGFLPLGTPDSELMRTDADRCATPVVLNGYYDATFNPDGSLPVITFCDGNDTSDAPGIWNPMIAPTVPAEVSFAVDINGNHKRDGGEPVIVHPSEPYADLGIDGVDDAHEGTGPDPANDDYDWQYNPTGTEGNARYDGPVGGMGGEPFDDVGFDGVMNTPQVAQGGYDVGEGNGTFDIAPGYTYLMSLNPLDRVEAFDDATLDRLAVWCDGGVRDIIDFGSDENHFIGGFARRGVGVHVFNGFAPLTNDTVTETAYDYRAPDWSHLPRRVMVRYGSLDAPVSAVDMGDGTHVGTPSQIIQRIESGIRFIGAQWPDADLASTPVRFAGVPTTDCDHDYSCQLTIHSDTANRDNPTILLFPPGYHDPGHENERYPVIVLLHGYGGDPSQYQGLSLLFGPAMALPGGASWQRLPKAIIVLADGHCRAGDRCLSGTFFANGIAGSAQIESAILDVIAYVDAHFRTLGPTDVTVTE